MRHSLFISDLHLCDSRPAITAQFHHFLESHGRLAERLYILGDLFEYWAGDDDIAADPHHASVVDALRTLAQTGVQVFFMHGNRDFLIGELFAEAAQLSLLIDPTLHDLYGHRILLSHGDTLCTDDVDYQAFRRQVRNPQWQAGFLATPLVARKAQIAAIRERSEMEKSGKQADIMDVNATAVGELLRAYDYPSLLIHGHTHRPACHTLTIDGHRCDRWVLGDWYEQGSCLRVDSQGVHAIQLPMTAQSATAS